MSTKTKYSADKALARVNVSLMSNAKWRALFRAVIAADLGIKRSEWKILGDDHVKTHRMPKESDLGDSHFNDGEIQPFAYKYIEWIFIPRKYRPDPRIPWEMKQNVDGLVSALVATGKKFSFDVDERGVTIYAYR